MNQCVGKALPLYVGLNMDHVLLCGIMKSWVKLHESFILRKILLKPGNDIKIQKYQTKTSKQQKRKEKPWPDAL